MRAARHDVGSCLPPAGEVHTQNNPNPSPQDRMLIHKLFSSQVYTSAGTLKLLGPYHVSALETSVLPHRIFLPQSDPLLSARLFLV